MTRRIALALITAAVSLGLGACIEDEDLILPRQDDETARVFQRYVAMGNSLTAGYMSGGSTVIVAPSLPGRPESPINPVVPAAPVAPVVPGVPITP